MRAQRANAAPTVPWLGGLGEMRGEGTSLPPAPRLKRPGSAICGGKWGQNGAQGGGAGGDSPSAGSGIAPRPAAVAGTAASHTHHAHRITLCNAMQLQWQCMITTWQKPTFLRMCARSRVYACALCARARQDGPAATPRRPVRAGAHRRPCPWTRSVTSRQTAGHL